MAENKRRTDSAKPPGAPDEDRPGAAPAHGRRREPSLARAVVELASAAADFTSTLARWLSAQGPAHKVTPGPTAEASALPPSAPETPDVSGVKNPEVAHEQRDINPRWVVGFGIGLIIAAVIIHLVLWWGFDFLAGRAARSLPPPPPLASEQSKLPPEPRLQGVPGHPTDPTEDLRQLRASEDAVLNNYGWVDPSAGTVRIPVERAMQLLAERGLPTRPQSPGQTTDQGIIMSPEISSSGRIPEKVQ